MVRINKNFKKLQGSYLFSQIARKVNEYSGKNPDKKIIRLGIGDVTLPLTASVIKALHTAVDEMSEKASFRGYAPDRGYGFLREAIRENDFGKRGCDIEADEIFVSDGAKCDSANIQGIFDIKSTIAVCDPVYPVYVDSNIMAGRGGEFLKEKEGYSGIIYMPCTAENDFSPELPEKVPDLIYLCSPNNPTGSVIDRKGLQSWVDYANENGSVIIFDAAYEAYIRSDDIPHSIYECRDASKCAIELHSFSKNAGFTGLRLGYAVVPKALKRDGVSLNELWARRHSTKYNGAPYIVQRAGEAVYSEEGQKEIRSLVDYYMENASYIKDSLSKAGFSVSGGTDAPYIWLKTPDNMTSWEFFDHLLLTAGVVGTPGSGFGPHGEGYFRLTAFGSHENTVAAVDRIVKG
ncbi:MAG: LL-diaminopimelate aminotransferase [Lachnospiraceae bacterium]|nr:LL-diaminopimelate aminotransferase [Lachnospiraceae bacterium]